MSAENKHTPGDWYVGWGKGISGPRVGPLVYLDDVTPPVYRIPVSVGDSAVCWLISVDKNDDLTADARLIAAAPTMYDYIRLRADAGDTDAQSILEAINVSR